MDGPAAWDDGPGVAGRPGSLLLDHPWLGHELAGFLGLAGRGGFRDSKAAGISPALAALPVTRGVPREPATSTRTFRSEGIRSNEPGHQGRARVWVHGDAIGCPAAGIAGWLGDLGCSTSHARSRAARSAVLRGPSERPRIRVRGVHGGRAAQLPARRRWWVRTSLGGALASSLGGVWGGLLAPTLLIPSIASAIAVLILWRDFERAQRDSRPFGKKSAHSEQAGHPSS
jgi:hypothetical protein